KVTPSEVTVSVRGPELVLKDWKLPEGAVFVDAGGLAPGPHDPPVQVDLPAPLEVTARRPETGRVAVPAPKEQGGTGWATRGGSSAPTACAARRTSSP